MKISVFIQKCAIRGTIVLVLPRLPAPACRKLIFSGQSFPALRTAALARHAFLFTRVSNHFSLKTTYMYIGIGTLVLIVILVLIFRRS